MLAVSIKPLFPPQKRRKNKTKQNKTKQQQQKNTTTKSLNPESSCKSI